MAIRPSRVPLLVHAFLSIAFALPATAEEATHAWRLVESLDARALSDAADSAYRIETAPLDSLRLAERMVLALPEGSFEFQRVSLATRAGGAFTWTGKRVGADGGSAVLTVAPGALHGLVYGDDSLYELSTGADGSTILIEIDQDRFPECHGGVDTPEAAADPDIAPEGPRGGDAEVDVLVLYTPQSRAGAGGAAQIINTAQAAVDAANLSFANSDMTTRFRIAGIHLWNRDESTLGGNASASLTTLRNDPWVAALRNATAADLVGLLVEDGQGGCGIGYVMRSPGVGFASSGYQITARTCAVGNLTYAHEHGHNMGFEHDPANGTSPGNASYPWSFGHFHDVGSSTERFRTVMSYSTQCSGGCTRRPYFSNPDIAYMGEPTGIENERDNARTGDDVFAIVRDFRNRATATLLFRDSFE